MALAHCVNFNCNPLLRTYYYKCMINITRLNTGYIKAQGKVVHDKNSKPFPTFEETITFRQHQAQRSILMRIETIDSVDDAIQFCKNFGNIENMFFYSTSMTKKFLLLEYRTKQEAERLQRMAKTVHITGSVNVISMLLSYRSALYKSRIPCATEYSLCNSTPTSFEIMNNLLQQKNVSQQMVSLYEILKMTELNVRLRFFTAHQMTFYLSQLFTNISVVPFGSSVNGFGQQGCDLDLLCKIENRDTLSTVWKNSTFLSQNLSVVDRKEQQHFLEMISIIIRRCIPLTSNVKEILNARVPILTFLNRSTNMTCDLSCTNMIALYMSELLYMYAELDSRVKPLVFTIRTWARNHNITSENPGHWITNFSLTLLILFYLQTKQILPSLYLIEDITAHNTKNLTSEPPLPWYSEWRKIIKNKNTETLHELLRGFFEFYSIFNFEKHAICLRYGTIKSKKTFSSPLYIYNIFDSKLNVSQNITVKTLSNLIEHFQNALEILDSTKEDIIIKLINLNQSIQKPGHTRKILDKKSNDNERNKNNHDTSGLESINKEMLTNEENTNVHADRKSV